MSENPFEPPPTTNDQPATTKTDESKPALDAKQAMRNAFRYALPVMAIGWLLLWVELYGSYSHRMKPFPALAVSCVASLGFASIGLGTWIGCAAIVGSLRQRE